MNAENQDVLLDLEGEEEGEEEEDDDGEIAHIFANYNKTLQQYWLIQAILLVELQPKIANFEEPTVQLECCPKGGCCNLHGEEQV
ncbi:hypothetical protein GRJ2_000086000 [Grus japonensis]|uniref:Uncharacterized protein n=1 Tax=Grus japonensis TaxID=30415 RepID=A0ABC9VSS1_GRUJA